MANVTITDVKFEVSFTLRAEVAAAIEALAIAEVATEGEIVELAMRCLGGENPDYISEQLWVMRLERGE